ncbi:MAG: hypothetical protein RBT69_05190 [Spirochaetia bacterium]|jgi:hypothetical protein|nr:hypothetical protein [Spirochaetia bacterium]
MKKYALLMVIIFFISTLTAVYAESSSSGKNSYLTLNQYDTGKSDKDINLDKLDKKLEGKGKIGLSLGYPTGITFGYQMTNFVEINTMLGLFAFDQFALGGSLLFTLADIVFKDNVFPLSFGPAVYLRTGDKLRTDVLGVLRLEHTFADEPLNVFIEAGAGLEVTPDTGFAGSGAIGIRYVF